MSNEEKNIASEATNAPNPSLGEVKIADEVVANIAALAANEVEGVVFSANYMKKDSSGKLRMKNLSKVIKVDVVEGVVIVSVTLTLKYNYSLMDVTSKVQKKIKDAIENMTGLKVADVNVKVIGVEMEV